MIKHILLFHKPNNYHIECFDIQCEKLLRLGMITKLPNVQVIESAITGFWAIELTIDWADQVFWSAFCEGVAFCQNAPEILRP